MDRPGVQTSNEDVGAEATAPERHLSSDSQSSTPGQNANNNPGPNDNEQQDPPLDRTEGSTKSEKEQNVIAETMVTAPVESNTTTGTFSSMFGFATSWGKKLQNDLQLEQLVDSVKKQSEELTKAYKNDISEFTEAVKAGTARSVDELTTRFNQIKTDTKPDLGSSETQDKEENSSQLKGRGINKENNGASGGLFTNIVKHFQTGSLKERQEKAQSLLSKLGTDLEDLLRDAIVIEAPGSDTTDEQRSAARKIIYDRRMAQLAAIQESEDTYLIDPTIRDVAAPGANNNSSSSPSIENQNKDGEAVITSTSSSNFEEFNREFDLDNKRKAEIPELLSSNIAVADMHNKLVPERVSDIDFWTRYYFRAWLIEQEELRRKKLVETAVAATEEEEFDWDLDGDSDVETNGKDDHSPINNDNDVISNRAEKSSTSDIAEDVDKDVNSADTTVASSSAKDSNEKKVQDSMNGNVLATKKSSNGKGNEHSNDEDDWDEWE